MELPVVIGMPGKVARRKLLMMSARIGVGPSIDFLRKQKGLRSLLSRRSTAERLYEGIVPMLDDPELAVDGFQYFTFNELCQTWKWHQKKLASNPKGSNGAPARRGTVGHVGNLDTGESVMTQSNLQELLDAAGNTVELLRNSQIGAYVYPVVPRRVHQLAPRAVRLARDRGAVRPVAPHGQPLHPRPGRAQAALRHGINTSRTSRSNMAKQFVPTTPSGHVIGDGILFHLAEEEFVYVGRAPVAELAALPRRDRRLRRRDRARTTARRRAP